MVFFVGWTFGMGETGWNLLGVYSYTYTLSVTFEGETFDLTQTFNVIEIPCARHEWDKN